MKVSLLSIPRKSRIGFMNYCSTFRIQKTLLLEKSTSQSKPPHRAIYFSALTSFCLCGFLLFLSFQHMLLHLHSPFPEISNIITELSLSIMLKWVSQIHEDFRLMLPWYLLLTCVERGSEFSCRFSFESALSVATMADSEWCRLTSSVVVATMG